MQGRRPKHAGVWEDGGKKKQQAEVFSCNTDGTDVCLVLLFSINTDMKKLYQYERWDLDKEIF